MEKVAVANRKRTSTKGEVEVSFAYSAFKRTFDIVVGVCGMIPVLFVSIVLLPFYMFGKDKGPLFLNNVELGKMVRHSTYINFGA